MNRIFSFRALFALAASGVDLQVVFDIIDANSKESISMSVSVDNLMWDMAVSVRAWQR